MFASDIDFKSFLYPNCHATFCNFWPKYLCSKIIWSIQVDWLNPMVWSTDKCLSRVNSLRGWFIPGCFSFVAFPLGVPWETFLSKRDNMQGMTKHSHTTTMASVLSAWSLDGQSIDPLIEFDTNRLLGVWSCFWLAWIMLELPYLSVRGTTELGLMCLTAPSFSHLVFEDQRDRKKGKFAHWTKGKASII